MGVFGTNTEIIACVQLSLLSEKIAVHGLLRLLNWHFVIELTSVKKG